MNRARAIDLFCMIQRREGQEGQEGTASLGKGHELCAGWLMNERMGASRFFEDDVLWGVEAENCYYVIIDQEDFETLMAKYEEELFA